MLENEQLIPRVCLSKTPFVGPIADVFKELIFLTRCQRMMQANNQLLGSPSARVNLTAKVRDPPSDSRIKSKGLTV